MATHDNQKRIWISRFVHQRIKALKRRKGGTMLELANDLIRDGLKVESGMREADRLIKARRDGR